MSPPLTCRPRDQLIALTHRFPNAWALAEQFRQTRGVEVPDWPEFVFLPMAGWYAILSGGGSNRVPREQIGELPRLAALGAWRVTQGVYRFDPTLYADLVATPIKGDIPSEILYRLPEWCVYIETPSLTMPDGEAVHGVWAHLEDDHRHGHELRLLVDVESRSWAIPLHLGKWSLEDAINRMLAVDPVPGGNLFASAAKAQMLQIAAPVLSLLLYLCTQADDVGDGTRRPSRPQPKRTKRGLRLFPAERVTTWDVGVRMGAALRRAYAATEHSSGGDTHASPRGHIRGFHWHTFRLGPMKTPEGDPIPAALRDFEVRWMPPIPVNLASVDDLPTTIKPVAR